MAFPVQHLLAHKPKPVWVSPAEPADGACRIMREHGFSQLPVVSDKGIALGLVTHESILRALGHFNVSLDRLRVSAALTSPRSMQPDDDFFDLLEALTDSYASLILDKENHLVGIVTQDDLLVYFRRRAEDLILVEEIELGLREHVLCAFSDQAGALLREELCSAVDEVADQASRFRRKFHRALASYMGTTNGGTKPAPINEAEADKAFKAFDLKYRAKELSDLTFEETRTLLLHEQRWATYGAAFGIDKKALSDLLERVRDSRNKLAHFRGDLSDDERECLRFCSQFLDNHRPLTKIPTVSSIREVPKPVTPPPPTSPGSAIPTAAPEVQTSEPSAPAAQEISSIEDEQDFEGSRYAPLVAHLAKVPEESVTFRFEEIERLLGRKLPATARRHRAWWANDRVSHAQSRLWLETGWRVSTVSVSAETVTFTRIRGREETYIDFFSRLLHETQRIGSPNGTNWHVIERVGTGEFGTSIICSFARGSRFRIELYIDLAIRDEERRRTSNKQLFDGLLAQRDDIEQKLGHPLEWERLDHRTASRIAFYNEGSILDEREKLNRLVKWSAAQLPLFLRAIVPSTTYLLEQMAKER